MPARRSQQQIHRKSRGAYYTPAKIAKHVARLAIGPWLAEASQSASSLPTVLDPACGDGAFLLASADLLTETLDRPNECRRGEIATKCLFGIDIEPRAVDDCRRRVAAWIVGDTTASKRQADWIARLERNIVHGNALVDASDNTSSSIIDAAPPVDFETMLIGGDRAHRGFDCVVGNPPYVNIRLASQQIDSTLRDYYRQRYRSARGAYDQYVLFLERACELLRTGGRYAWILPNKLAGADYASDCREIMSRETTIQRWEDLSSEKVFADAGVYPLIIAGVNQPPSVGHRVETSHWGRSGTRMVPATNLRKAGWRLTTSFEIESRVATIALGEFATLHSGATGFQARQLAEALVEAEELDDDNETFTFITSGNIDRYRIDDHKVRFMKRRFRAARLPVDASILTANKQRLYTSPKIVIAGMTQRLEAAYDRSGRALGVQVYAALDFECDPHFLLGVLNSRLMSHLFRQRFAAKQLSGGYLSINKAQLVQLPIAVPNDDGKSAGTIASTAKRLERLRDPTKVAREERLLDAAVYSLYGISTAEISEIDHAFRNVA